MDCTGKMGNSCKSFYILDVNILEIIPDLSCMFGIFRQIIEKDDDAWGGAITAKCEQDQNKGGLQHIEYIS